jgi:4a-hydroxytetrahydrobiopterin dehydratase
MAAGALNSKQVADRLKKLKGWKSSGGAIEKTFKFPNYYETMAFVNAVAFIAHGEDHHPDLTVGYNNLVVRYSTHSVGGLSASDFSSAAKVDALARK